MSFFKTKFHRSAKSKLAARMPARLVPADWLESLESRCLLSVSASALAGPVTIPNNTWTYTLTSSSGEAPATLVEVSKGATTFNGVAAIELDVTGSQSGKTLGLQKIYYAFLSQGFVLLGSSSSGASSATSTDVWSPPYHLIAPDQLNAMVPFTTPVATETTTFVNNSGTTTSSLTKTDAITLQSDSPTTSVSVPAGTYNTYEFDTTETTTSGGTSNTTTEQSFVAPGTGIIKLVTTDGPNTTTEVLGSFVGTSFQLKTTTPNNGLVDDPLSPVAVSIVDTNGNLDTKSADAVTVTASIGAASTGTGTLGGTTQVTTSGGIANFSNLTVNKPGSYVLSFKDNTGRTISTQQFQVAAGKLIFKKRISNAIAGSAIEPAVEVELVDSKGKVITDAPSLVTLNITGSNSTNPITGNAVDLVNGIALFPALKLGAPGNYVLSATDAQGDVSATSNEFEVTGVHLVFKKQPSEVGVGGPIKYVIQLEDSRNRRINRSNIGLALQLNTVDGGAGAQLSSVADTVDFGVANNSGPGSASINTPGTYTITFTVISQASNGFDYTIDPITSESFQVVANHLHFVHQPLSSRANFALQYKVEMLDFKNHLVSTNADQLTLSLVPINGSTGVLSSNTDSLLAGSANNSGSRASINDPGSYQLTVIDISSDPAIPAAQSTTSKVFKIKATRT